MDAQTDLSLHWAHMSKGTFSHVRAQISSRTSMASDYSLQSAFVHGTLNSLDHRGLILKEGTQSKVHFYNTCVLFI